MNFLYDSARRMAEQEANKKQITVRYEDEERKVKVDNKYSNLNGGDDIFGDFDEDRKGEE